jgi:hypothetical protein
MLSLIRGSGQAFTTLQMWQGKPKPEARKSRKGRSPAMRDYYVGVTSVRLDRHSLSGSHSVRAVCGHFGVSTIGIERIDLRSFGFGGTRRIV